MKRGRRNLARVADALEAVWSIEAFGVGRGASRRIEALVHELAHATVLGFAFRKHVEDETAEWFRTSCRSSVGELSECRALAVEREVLKVLRLDVGWQRVCREASGTMTLSGREVVRTVIRMGRNRPQTIQRRAAKVLRAIRRVAQKEGVTV